MTTSKVGQNSPVAHENILKEELEVNNHGVDLPILLDQATSIVTTSDAGAGVGYTGIRVRGTDATRVNITINEFIHRIGICSTFTWRPNPFAFYGVHGIAFFATCECGNHQCCYRKCFFDHDVIT